MRDEGLLCFGGEESDRVLVERGDRSILDLRFWILEGRSHFGGEEAIAVGGEGAIANLVRGEGAIAFVGGDRSLI